MENGPVEPTSTGTSLSYHKRKSENYSNRGIVWTGVTVLSGLGKSDKPWLTCRVNAGPGHSLLSRRPIIFLGTHCVPSDASLERTAYLDSLGLVE